MGQPRLAPQHGRGHFFDLHERYNEFVAQAGRIQVPDFYRQLGALPVGSLTLLEAPWRFEHPYNALDVYQRQHRQNVVAGMIGGLCVRWWAGEVPPDASGYGFRHLVHLGAVLANPLRAGADFLVFHRRHWNPDVMQWWPDLSPCRQQLTERLGPPVYADDEIDVFRLSPRAPVLRPATPAPQHEPAHGDDGEGHAVPAHGAGEPVSAGEFVGARPAEPEAGGPARLEAR